MSRPPISYPIAPPELGAYEDTSSQRQLGVDTSSLTRDSSFTSRGMGGQARGPTSTLDSFITRLLVVTKQLLQGLEQWSQRKLSEEAVSDIYVRLGNGFELCVTAFRRVGISTADLDSVPNDLREILERALAEDPSQDTLNIYLPDIRAIIFNLLSGLKNKQISYKRLLVERQQTEVLSPTPSSRPIRPPPSGSTPVVTEYESSIRSFRSANSDGPTSPSSTSSQLPAPRQPSAAALAERSQQRSPVVSRPAPPDTFRPPRSRAAAENANIRREPPHPLPLVPGDSRRSPIPTLSGAPSPLPPTGPSQPPARPAPHPDRFSREHLPGLVTSRFSADSEVSVDSTLAPPESHSPPGGQNLPPDMRPSPPAVPPVVPALSLPVDEPLGNEPESPHEPSDSVHPAVRSSLALLQRSDALERRASKRFSSFTFNKMLPGSPNGKRSSGDSPQRPARRSDRLPPLPALLEDLNGRSGSPELDDGSVAALQFSGSAPASPVLDSTVAVGTAPERSSPTFAALSPPAQAPVSGPSPPLIDAGSVIQPATVAHQPSPAPSNFLTAYLQLGRQVKKTTIELPLTMSALRLMFLERFEYDPGMEDFPDVYIRDNKTGVQYELEDMDDLKDGCVLTLDIEPLDQVKQHFDITFASLAQEIKDLKTSLNQSKRLSTQVHPSLLAVAPPRPLERTPELSPSAQLPHGSNVPIPSAALPSNTDFRVHYEEVQSLRRDLAIMRQLHLDFLNQTKESFSTLRAQNSAMREVVKTKMGGSRALLDNSKAKLDERCQDTIQSVEEISDIIDGAREDALRRGVTPSRAKMEKIRADLTKATNHVESFANDVALAEPTWRATWLSELKRVTDEQRLLGYQSKLATDLKNDIKDAIDMLDNVQAFVDQRQAGTSSKKFTPVLAEEGSGGIPNLLLEIRTKESDPHQRLRAIEEQQKARERELASKTDEFQHELSGFVQGKKLRKTGGTDEAERVRQRRQEQTLKRMLTEERPDSPSGAWSPHAGPPNLSRSASDGTT